MPVLFLGHGNPMNAIQKNPFTHMLKELGVNIPTPRLILCISAHWMTQSTWLTHMPKPKTIHDFSGFPQELFNVEYPAPGSPHDAEKIQSLITEASRGSEIRNLSLQLDDHHWGLDHGTWSLLVHMYPQATIPVIQLSLDLSKPPKFHYQLGQSLSVLREQGVLIIGSGNIVHNLRMIKWEENAEPYDWAIEFDQWVKEKILKRDDLSLISDATSSESGQLSIPTPDHWYPLLYALGASRKTDEIHFDYEAIDHGSIAMRCVRWK